MRALSFDGRDVRLGEQHPEPEPREGEALIRPRLAAVCGLDVEIARGLGPFTGVLGHEFVGVVEAVNGADPNKLAGQRVVGNPATFCGSCPMCQAGLSTHCRERTILGISGRDGCLADRFTLPVQNLLRVPDDLDDDHAVFTNLVAAAMQSVRQLTIEGKPYITVLGDGPLGLVMVQLMARLNASVRLIGRYSEKLALCEKWKIKHRHVDDIGRRADQDVVVDCTGSPTGLELAMQLVRPRGTILVKTMLGPESRLSPGIDLSPLVRHELQLIGSFLGPTGEALRTLTRRELDVVSLIGRRMKLDDGPELLAAATSPGARRVLVAF